jgi:hypothetical protein
MNQKAEIAKLMNKILDITMELKDRFPESYNYLNETPVFYSVDKKELNLNDFEGYLSTIQSQLKVCSNLADLRKKDTWLE